MQTKTALRFNLTLGRMFIIKENKIKWLSWRDGLVIKNAFFLDKPTMFDSQYPYSTQ